MKYESLTETLLAEELKSNDKPGSLETYSAVVLYSSSFGSAASGFGPAGNFGLGGGGIAKNTFGTPIIERYRFDASHDVPHINLEFALNTNVRKRPLLTKHIKIDLY